MDRRHFLRLGATAAAVPLAGGVLAACGDGGDKTDAATTATTKGNAPLTPMKFGFIALTDAAPVIMAKELGYFAERGIDATVEKQASWPVTRDALLNGQIDAAHCLYSMPFSVATGIGGAGSRDMRVVMMLSANGQAITLGKEFAEVGYGNVKRAGELLSSKQAPTLAMTFPGGTHDLWLRYWVQATGADATKLKIDPVPPPQMVQNMSVGNIQGYCVGEPWNAVAVQQKIGFTHITSQDIWDFHPEKALVTTAKVVAEKKAALKAAMAAVLAAAKWLDVPANRSKAADTLGLEQYVNAPAADIRGRLTGTYDLGEGLGMKDFKGRQMQFFQDGEVSFPRRAHAIWALAQFGRLGLLKDPPAYAELAQELILTDLYTEVAKAEGISVPDDDMSAFDVKLDNATFDPAKPELEVARA